MVDLTPFNTLHLPVKSQNLIQIDTTEDISRLPRENIFLLGAGANVLFTHDFPGTIGLVKIPGLKIVQETDSEVMVEFGAGVNWHDSVTWAIDHNLSGMENMALIPGTVGAAPVGNIAAYGQNQEDIFDHLTAANLQTGKTQIFSKSDCQFRYRESIFKSQSLNLLITSVTYKLSKVAHLELSYHAAHHASLLPTLQSLATPPYTIRNVYDAVIRLRTEKLPDPDKIGTAGSFFKNPVVTASMAAKLKSQIPDLQTYPAEKLSYIDQTETTQMVKIPAGMLLDKLGWRGKRIGNVGTFPTHALTVVAYPGATGSEVYNFSESMRADFQKNYGINLEYEVIIV